jgi:hypothetical protein
MPVRDEALDLSDRIGRGRTALDQPDPRAERVAFYCLTIMWPDLNVDANSNAIISYEFQQ